MSKIERGFEQDLVDVRAMISRGLVEPARLHELYEAIEQSYIDTAIDQSGTAESDAALTQPKDSGTYIFDKPFPSVPRAGAELRKPASAGGLRVNRSSWRGSSRARGESDSYNKNAPGGNRTRGLRFERPLLFGSPKRTVDH